MSSDSTVRTSSTLPLSRRILASPWTYALIALILGMAAASAFAQDEPGSPATQDSGDSRAAQSQQQTDSRVSLPG